MDPRTTPEQDAFRAEARAFLEEHCPQDLPPLDSPEGFPLHVEWEKKLFAHRWAVVDWPEEYGGRDCSLVEWLIFEEEYYRVGGPQRATQNGIFLLGPAILHFGTDEQKQRLLPKIASAEELWCQGWSEPGAGSDLAALTSRAERVDGGFKLYGAKTWSTRGTFSDKTFGLFRTDPGSSRHKGLTYFLVDLRAEGVSVRPINKLDGDEGFAEIFLDGAFVPDRDILGEVDKGWYVAMATTGPERGLTLRSPGRFMAQAARLVDLAKRGGDAVGPALRERVAARWMEAEAYRQYKTLTDLSPKDPLAWLRLANAAAGAGRIDEALRPAVGDWIFGCDVCQDVCPYNRTELPPPSVTAPFAPSTRWDAHDAESILEMSDHAFGVYSEGSPGRRTGRDGMARNAALVLGNRGERCHLPVLDNAARTHLSPVVRETAAWAARTLRERLDEQK